MARNGSGSFSLTSGNPVTTGTSISSTWANATLSDIASALTQSVSKDGQTTMTGNLPMGNNKVTGLADGTLATDAVSLGQLAGDAGASLVGYLPAGTGAVATTVQTKLRESVSVKDFGAVGDGTTDDTAAITAALAASKHVTVPSGFTPLISSTIVIPNHTRLEFLGGVGNSLGEYPASYFIKKSTMTTNGITMGNTSVIDGGGLYCQAGNTGDGVALVSNSGKLRSFLVHGAGGVGIRVGLDAGSNANNCELYQVVSQYNGGDGIYIHDGKNAPPDANVVTVTQAFSQHNGGHGINLGHCNWVTLLNCLTEVNTGYGLYVSNTVMAYDTVEESKYHTVIGGDYNEGNTLGSVYAGGYACGIYQPDPNQLMTIAGTRNQVFGMHNSGGAGAGGIMQGLTMQTYGIKFTPGTQSAIADANTLDDYVEGSYTGTATGMTTSPTGTFTYTKVGNQVTINFPRITGTSNATTFTVTGMPAALFPTADRIFICRTVNNGTTAATVGWFDTSGILNLANNLTQGGGSWTAAGTKELLIQSISYTK